MLRAGARNPTPLHEVRQCSSSSSWPPIDGLGHDGGLAGQTFRCPRAIAVVIEGLLLTANRMRLRPRWSGGKVGCAFPAQALAEGKFASTVQESFGWLYRSQNCSATDKASFDSGATRVQTVTVAM
jgi:hypothetical protein